MVIYMITNKLNGKRYVGQTTGSLNLRWKSHCKNSKSKHGIFHLAVHKYGKENFEIKVLAKCNSIEEMNHREVYYIRLLNTLAPNGYNLDSGGKNKTLHQITRNKISESHKGKMKGQNNHNFGKYPEAMVAVTKKPIVCVTTGEKFNSLSDAARKYGLMLPKISSVCKLKRRHTGGYVFRYLGEENLIFNKIKRIPKTPHMPKHRKPVMCIELGIRFEKIMDAVRFIQSKGIKIDRSSIRNTISGKNRTAGGYTWRAA